MLVCFLLGAPQTTVGLEGKSSSMYIILLVPGVRGQRLKHKESVMKFKWSTASMVN